MKLLDDRLLSAIPFVTPGGIVADIGTDHAYLPIELCRQGICARAVACDINRGPIDSARANIAAAHMEDRIDTCLTDGLHGVEHYCPNDILIFGMGGELIVRILEEAPWVRNGAIGLVLQPMSRAEVLRRYLWENGFEVYGERLSRADRIYQTIAARWSGTPVCDVDEVDLLVGSARHLRVSPLALEFLRGKCAVLERTRDGKRAGGADCENETRLIRALNERIETLQRV